jgi:hypothetical protein
LRSDDATTKTVTFDNEVTVNIVPSHLDYSERMRKTLWFSSEEMQFNYARNVIEFTAEDWNPEHCLEEDQFIITDDGALIHPVHLLREQNLTRHFCTVMSAQHQRQMVC